MLCQHESAPSEQMPCHGIAFTYDCDVVMKVLNGKTNEGLESSITDQYAEVVSQAYPSSSSGLCELDPTSRRQAYTRVSWSKIAGYCGRRLKQNIAKSCCRQWLSSLANYTKTYAGSTTLTNAKHSKGLSFPAH